MQSSLLRGGDRGDSVRDLQERLVAAGFKTEPDGTFGSSTEDAVRSFQARRGLRVDGICGPETWGALVESGFRPGDRLLYHRRPMLRGDDVAELQRRLNALGFDAGSEDGILGPNTEAAIKRFQREAGIATDGVCGPATLAALARLGTLAAGSVASVREREHFRRDVRRLAERRIFFAADPGLDALASAVVRGLREDGAEVVLDTSGQDPSAVAAEANRYAADICLKVGPGDEPESRCAYFATETFRSEAGFSIASRVSETLNATLDGGCVPVGRTYRILRETRMAAVAVELSDAELAVAPQIPELAAALVLGIRRGVEDPD